MNSNIRLISLILGLSMNAWACNCGVGPAATEPCIAPTDPLVLPMPAANPIDPNPSYYEHIEPIMVKHCLSCHHAEGPGQVAWSITRLDGFTTTTTCASPDCGSWCSTMAYDVRARIMPPFMMDETTECPEPKVWTHDARLTPEEIQTFVTWAEQDCPRGDEPMGWTSPSPPAPQSLPDGLEVDTPIKGTVAAGQHDQYLCYPLDLNLNETAYLTGMQFEAVNADGRLMDHHAVFFYDPAGNSAKKKLTNGSYECFGGAGKGAAVIGAWAPGAPPIQFPSNSGITVKPGARIVLQLHYAPNELPGAVERNPESKVMLSWANTKPQKRASSIVFGAIDEGQAAKSSGIIASCGDPEGGPKFVIPPTTLYHEEVFVLDKLKSPARIFNMLPHMHLAGRNLSLMIERANPEMGEEKNECLAHAARWEFDQQKIYYFGDDFNDMSQLPTIGPGDKLTIKCVFRNLSTTEITVGENTDNEMCAVILGVVYD